MNRHNISNILQACLYDYVVTKDSGYAEQTKKYEAMSSNIWSTLNESVVRCPALPRPLNGRKSENRYWPGTIVRFVCNEGYRLVGYEVRRCREDGLWSWGVDPECVPELVYRLNMSFIYSSLIIPTIVIVLVIIYLAWRFYSKKNHSNEGKQHIPSTLLASEEESSFDKEHSQNADEEEEETDKVLAKV